MRLAVVICTYDNAALLARTLEHLEAQAGADPDAWEVIVVANRCTDDTAAVAAACAARGRIPHFRCVEEMEQGLAFARRRGVRECPGADCIAWVDDDNFLAPDWIALALEFGEKHPACGVWGGLVEIVWEIPPEPVFQSCAYAYARLDLGPGERRLEGEERWRLKGAGMICRRAALLATGWLDWQACIGRAGGSAMAGDDLEIVMRIARAGHEVWWQSARALRHFITARRITFPYLRRLHYGFGLAHLLLLGMKGRRSRFILLAAALRFYLLQSLKVLRRALAGLFRREQRQRAILDWEYLRGSVLALGGLLRLSPADRRAWLQNPPSTP